MNRLDTGLLSIEQATGIYLNTSNKTGIVQTEGTWPSFEQILKEKTGLKDEEVVFSKHANERLLSRNIYLSDEQKTRLNEGVSRARDKSINESLVMMDNLAFIVNIKNNTVITALEQNDDSVFTNIDGAVIV